MFLDVTELFATPGEDLPAAAPVPELDDVPAEVPAPAPPEMPQPLVAAFYGEF